MTSNIFPDLYEYFYAHKVHQALLGRGEQGRGGGDHLPRVLLDGDTHPHVLRQEVAEIIIVIIIISSPPANCS